MYAKQSGAILHPLHQTLEASLLQDTSTNITVGFRNQNPKRPLTAPRITSTAARKRKSAVLSMYAKLPNCDSPLHQALEAKPFTAHLRRPDRQLNSMKKRRDFRVTPLFCGIILPRTVCVSPQPVPGRPREKRSGGGTTGLEDGRFSAAAPGGPAGRGRSGPAWFPEQRRTFR